MSEFSQLKAFKPILLSSLDQINRAIDELKNMLAPLAKTSGFLRLLALLNKGRIMQAFEEELAIIAEEEDQKMQVEESKGTPIFGQEMTTMI